MIELIIILISIGYIFISGIVSYIIESKKFLGLDPYWGGLLWPLLLILGITVGLCIGPFVLGQLISKKIVEKK